MDRHTDAEILLAFLEHYPSPADARGLGVAWMQLRGDGPGPPAIAGMTPNNEFGSIFVAQRGFRRLM